MCIPCGKKRLAIEIKITMSSTIKCAHDHDDFCFVCGRRIFATATKGRNKRRTYFVSGEKFRAIYKTQFNFDPKDRDERWSPKVACSSCYSQFTNETRTTNILTPMNWMVPTNHPTDCYFCQTVVPAGINRKRQGEIIYANVSSVKKPKYIPGVDASETLTIYDEDASDPGDFQMEDFDEDEIGEPSGSTERRGGPNPDEEPMSIDTGDPNAPSTSGAFRAQRPVSPATSYMSATSGNGGNGGKTPIMPGLSTSATPFPSPSSGSSFQVPKHFSFLRPPKPPKKIDLSQARLNDIVRDMDLTKDSAEMLGSRLRDMGLGEGTY